VGHARGRYGNYWDVFTMECLEQAAADPTTEPLQRCKMLPISYLLGTEPALHPAEVGEERVEVREFSIVAFIIENIFTYLTLLGFGFCLCGCGVAYCAVKSPKAKDILRDIAGRAQRAKILGLDNNEYLTVDPAEEDSFLQSSDLLGDEAYELEYSNY